MLGRPWLCCGASAPRDVAAPAAPPPPKNDEAKQPTPPPKSPKNDEDGRPAPGRYVRTVAPCGALPPLSASPGDPSTWRLRVGPAYGATGAKAPSGPALYEFFGCDVAVHGDPAPGAGGRYALPRCGFDAHGLPEVWVLHLAIPANERPAVYGQAKTGPTASLLLFFRLTAATAAAAADPATAPPAVRLLQRYVAEAPACAPDKPGTRGRAKLLVRKAADRVPRPLRRYNGKPVLLDRSSLVASGPGYFEVFSNLRYWCYPARLAIFALWAKFSHAAVDACLVLEGRDDDELPEVALGCCALSKIDLDGAPVGWDA